MQLFHNSHDVAYRCPFGAVATGESVRLSLRVISKNEPESVKVRLWIDDAEKLVDMEPESKKKVLNAKSPDLSQENMTTGVMYSADIEMPSEGQLVWYFFKVELDGETVYYTNNNEKLGGVGITVAEHNDMSYQITVYDKDYKTPDWFKGKIMYQIFTDRFYGDHSETNGAIPKKRNEYVIHNDWYEPIAFNKHPYEMGPACNDFYGGNLKGIIDKLDYLKSLGVGVIYLNPIFDAYSNHKYDTADYMNVDPMFGTNETFSRLCVEAKKRDIRIILDGVFSHTGADSMYFNKYGNYGGNVGAFKDPNSEYREWYQFTNYPNYASWWGSTNLPNVNEMTPSYLDYILRGENSVVKTWVRRGASGWRLDVADELPDEFIKILRSELKSEDPDAVIIGEVWEDASNKVAYSEPRKYLLGKELDTVMNYPFKDNLLSFILGSMDAGEMNARLMSIFENYPRETVHSLMNIIGTHDTMRIKTLMGGLSDDCGNLRLTSGNETLATYRVMLLAFVQMTFVGVPCIYYGDEVGMQGGKDPFNRGTYPWRAVDPELREWYTRLGQLRNSISCLNRGSYKTLYASGDVFIYARYTDGGKDAFGKKADNSTAICAVNRSFESRHIEVDLSVLGEYRYFAHGVAEADIVKVENNMLEVDLPPLGCGLYLSREHF